MKFSTRARYGLRIMVEMARLLQTERLVQLHRIASITGLSNNYLSQLAIGLRDANLIVGVSGKKGGYHMARSPEKITIREIIVAVQGRIFATDCVINPELCMNAEFCEARTIWAVLTHRMQEVLDEFTLADLIDPGYLGKTRKQHPDIPYLNLENIVSGDSPRSSFVACQQAPTAGDEHSKE
jgi:Rrf2 family protein